MLVRGISVATIGNRVIERVVLRIQTGQLNNRHAHRKVGEVLEVGVEWSARGSEQGCREGMRIRFDRDPNLSQAVEADSNTRACAAFGNDDLGSTIPQVLRIKDDRERAGLA